MNNGIFELANLASPGWIEEGLKIWGEGPPRKGRHTGWDNKVEAEGFIFSFYWGISANEQGVCGCGCGGVLLAKSQGPPLFL